MVCWDYSARGQRERKEDALRDFGAESPPTDLTLDTAQQLITDGTVQGGMIPKLETCIAAVRQGAEAAVILDGRAPHAVLVELFTEHGIGTLITKD